MCMCVYIFLCRHQSSQSDRIIPHLYLFFLQGLSVPFDANQGSVDSTVPAGSLYYPALCLINWTHYKNWESLANCFPVIDY